LKLLSIDPGKHHYAWAWWLSGKLQDCGRTGNDWERCQGLVQELYGVIFDTCVIELPQVYQQRKWKGDPNDLIQVALTVGALGAWIQMHSPAEVKLVRPHTWKGSVPKDIMGNRILSKLETREEKIVKLAGAGLGNKKHDVVDAVGIGLWSLGRLE
jgi:hypothetical protein